MHAYYLFGFGHAQIKHASDSRNTAGSREFPISVEETSCWQVVGTALPQLINKLATNLLQTHLVGKLVEQHCHNLLTSLLQACRGDILLTSCWNSIATTYQQACYKPIANTSCWQVVGTALPQLVNKLATSLSRRHLVDKLLVGYYFFGRRDFLIVSRWSVHCDAGINKYRKLELFQMVV
jgi:uncharacterized protein with HEPN domain